jgi:spore photoproduct lyase
VNSEKFEKNITNTLFFKLPIQQREFLKKIAFLHNFSFQDLKQLIDIAIDLQMWEEGSISELWSEEKYSNLNSKTLKKALINDIKNYYEKIKNSPTSYKSTIETIKAPKIKIESLKKDNLGFGLCPVASPKTRCCNLLTLDAVESCGFDCSYCSIQSFYNDGKISFDTSLKDKLKNITLDAKEFYHIGTGQSSDSLMWGNRFGVLDSLVEFAQKNPNVMLEFKTKSDQVSYFLERDDLPPNLLFTWSLNPQIIIDNEEHLSASLNRRLEAAKKMQKHGYLVGFHFHPMIYIENFEKEYGNIFKTLKEEFDPKYVALVSLGTLTFIKPVLKMIRQRDFKSKILQLPMMNANGKYSYPLAIKKEMFKYAYDSLSAWHNKVYFYMCMEDHSLWRDVFGYEYPTNESFELDMKLHYIDKINSIRRK